MSNQFELTVPSPPATVMQRLESARKEMAPRIGKCTSTDAQGTFVCRINYANAYAIVTATAIDGATATRAVVDLHGITVLTSLWGKITVGVLIAAWLLDSVTKGSKSILELVWVPIVVALLLAGELMLVPLSTKVLMGFVRQTLLDEPDSPVGSGT